MDNEIWKPIVGYEGLYEVSNHARIRTLGRNVIAKDGRHMHVPPHIHKQCLDVKGYCYVKLYKDGKQKNMKVHRAVMEAFVQNPENKPFIDHINTIKDDNRLENLRWVTAHENTQNPITLQRIKDACTKEEISRQISAKKEHGSWNGKKVFQYTKDMTFVAEHETIMSAASQFSKNARQIQGNITKAIDNPNKSAYGYKWYSKRIEPVQ